MVLSWTPAPGARHGYDYRYSESASNLEAGAGPSWNHVANSNIASDHIDIPSGHLTIGTTYYFQVRGMDIDGNAGPASDVSERVIQLAVPSQVDNLISSAGDGSVTLAWRAPPAGELVTGYQYRVNPNPDGGTGWSDWSVLSTSDTTPNQSDVAGLTNGVAYSFQVRAVSAVGEAAEVSTTSASPTGPPAAPRDLSAKAGDAQVSLSWIDPNDSSITRYQYRQRVATEDLWPTNWTDIPSGAETTTSYVVTGLNNDTEYFFQVHATSEGGNSVPSEVSATPAVGTTAPPKLQNVKATGSRESGRIQITWNDPGDPDISNMHHYQFRRDADSPNPDSWDTDWSAISGRDYFNVSNGTVSWDFLVAADQSWFYQVRAVNDRSTYKTGDDLYGAASNSVLAATLTDAIPQVSSALPSRPFWRQWSAWSGTISVHWQDPEDPSITHYQIKWKQDEGDYGDWQDIQHSGYGEINSTSFTASGLTNGVQYTLVLRAVNAVGAGPESEPWIGTPERSIPERPTGLIATPGDTEVTLFWDDPGDDTIINYEYYHKLRGGHWTQWREVPDSDFTTRAHTVTGLENGLEHTISIRATNSFGGGQPAAPVRVTPLRSTPDVVTGLRATRHDAAVTLSWSNPGDPRITNFQFRLRAGPGEYGEWTDIVGDPENTTAHRVEGLTNGVEYAFQVRAVYATGYGPDSDSVSVTPVENRAPEFPGDTVTRSVPENLTADANVGTASTAHDEDDGDTLVYSLSGIDASSFAISGDRGQIRVGSETSLDYETKSSYTVTVSVTDYYGASDHIEVAIDIINVDEAGVVMLSSTQPQVGVELTATLIDPDGNISGVTWSWERSDIGDVWDFIVGADTSSYIPDTADLGNYLLVTAAYSDGEGPGKIVRQASARQVLESAAQTAQSRPPRPTGVRATPGDGQVILSWSDAGDASITGWRYSIIESGTGNNVWHDIEGSNAGTSSHVVTGLTNGSEYRFRVMAVNLSGQGSASKPAVRATPTDGTSG